MLTAVTIFILCSVCLRISFGFDVEIWVIVLDSKAREFDDLVRRWRPLLPSATFKRMPAVALNTPGLGICLSFLTVLSFEAASPRPTIIFESDARPFANVRYNRTFDDPFDGFEMYFLGGHSVRPRDDRRHRVAGWTPIQRLWGAYGIVVPSHARKRAADLIRRHCLLQRSRYSIDDVLSVCLDSAIATPLLVDHPKRAFSETWQKYKYFPWAGSRQWWEFEHQVYSRGWNCTTTERNTADVFSTNATTPLV